MNKFLYHINKTTIMLRVGLFITVISLAVVGAYFKDSIASTLVALGEPAISSTEKQKNSQEKGLALPPKNTSSAQPTDFKASSATDKTRAITRRCSVIFNPFSAHIFSIRSGLLSKLFCESLSVINANIKGCSFLSSPVHHNRVII